MVPVFTAVVLALVSVSIQARSAIRKDDSSTLVVGGNTARLGQFPYQIQVFDDGTSLWCGGSLVRVNGTQVVITTAHNIARLSQEYIALRGGVLNRDENNWLQQWRWPDRFVSHPDFDPISLQNDIALIFFKIPFLRNDFVNLVSLPERFEEVTPGTNVTVTGWGRMTGGDFIFLLQYVEIPVISNKQCNASWSAANGTEILDSQLCTGDSVGIASPCHYDGGGPAVTEDGVLVGVVSWGKDDCANTDTHPSVYTKVSHYIDWIEETVQNYQKSQS